MDKICSNIERCVYTTSDDVCYGCEENYYYNRSSELCELEKENFKNCKFTDYTGEVCDRCKDDIYYINLKNHLCFSNEEKGIFINDFIQMKQEKNVQVVQMDII